MSNSILDLLLTYWMSIFCLVLPSAIGCEGVRFSLVSHIGRQVVLWNVCHILDDKCSFRFVEYVHVLDVKLLFRNVFTLCRLSCRLDSFGVLFRILDVNVLFRNVFSPAG